MVDISSIKTSKVAVSFINDSEDAEMRRACKDFEAVFISYLLKSMRRTIPKTGLAQNELCCDIYTSMMDDEIANAVAKGPGIGLADALYRQLTERKISKVMPPSSRYYLRT